MSVELFSRKYISVEKVEDSDRARNRFIAMFEELRYASDFPAGELAKDIKLKLGVQVPFQERHRGCFYYFDSWYQRCELRDWLDSITLLYLKLQGETQNEFMLFTNEIFIDAGLPYEINDTGSVGYRVDAEFARDINATICGLKQNNFKGANDKFIEGVSILYSLDGNNGTAIYTIFQSLENIFRIIFPNVSRLGTKEIKEQLKKSTLETIYEGRNINAMSRIVIAFCEWVNACHQYRHADGKLEKSDVPLDVAVLIISNGSAYLRWLLDFKQRYDRIDT